MQNKSFTANTPIVAPCGAEGFDLISTAAFSVQYNEFYDNIPVGDAAPALPYGSSYKFTVWAPRGFAFKPTKTIAIISGASAAVVACPVRLSP